MSLGFTGLDGEQMRATGAVWLSEPCFLGRGEGARLQRMESTGGREAPCKPHTEPPPPQKPSITTGKPALFLMARGLSRYNFSERCLKAPSEDLSPTLLLAALLRSKGKIQMRDCPLRTSQLLLSGKSPPSRSQCPPLILLAVDIRPEKGLVRPWNQSVWLSGRRLSRETSPLKP